MCKGGSAITKEYVGDDPLGFIISHNLTRRHLDEGQRGSVAAKIANLKEGNPTGSNQHKSANRPIGLVPKISQSQAAAMMNVSVRTVRRAKDVMDKGEPELQEMVESGEIPVSAAARVAALPKPAQRRAISGGVAGVKEAARSQPVEETLVTGYSARCFRARHESASGPLLHGWRRCDPLLFF